LKGIEMKLTKFYAVLLASVLTGNFGTAQADEPEIIDLNLIFPIDVEELARPNPIDTDTYRNAAVSAYSHALRDGKYTVVLFSKQHRLNGFALRLAERLRDESLAKYSDRLVMCLTDPDLDDGGRDLADALEVEAYPTLVVLKTNRDQIHVTGQMIGEHELEAIDKFLQDSMKEPMRSKSSDALASQGAK